MSLYDELKKYEEVLTALNSLNSNIEALQGEVKNLKSDLVSNFNIDLKGLEEDNLDKAITNLDNAIAAINGNYTTAVNNKITEIKAEIARREAEEAEKKKKEQEKEKEKENNKESV